MSGDTKDDDEREATGIMISNSYPESLARNDLENLGLILPIASPEQLRAVFAEKQRIYAAILDQSDYIYSVAYTENGRARQQVYARKKDAEKCATAYGVEVRASPKKSGVVKLAAALGIEAQRVDVKGLPADPTAAYSSVVYEAVHKRTGRKEQGVGWCDTKERPKIHDVIATADTRAYNRAVLRLAGFGDVSADEIIGDTEDAPNGLVVDIVPEAATPTTLKKPMALPATSEAVVLSASRAWAEAIANRPVATQYAPGAQQSSKMARDLRARARRGDESAARELGIQGFNWEGPAQDESGVETFQVESPPVKPSDVQRVRDAAAESKTTTAQPDEKAGWDLSGSGSKNDDKPTSGPAETTRAAATNNIVAPSPHAEPITTVQAKSLSEKLLRALGTKEAASSWLKENASAARSLEVKSNQYDSLVRALDEMIAKKGV